MTDYELKPLVPMDLPEEVWDAVAANYNAEWPPSPNCHAEYRDARVAVEAFKVLLWKIVFEDANVSYEHRMRRVMDALEPGRELDV